jgi:hypothetical protein
MKIDQIISESVGVCSECGGPSFTDLILAEKKDACYHKVKASAKVWPSAYASGRLVQCRKKGASNYGNKSEGVAEGELDEGWKETLGAATLAGAMALGSAGAQARVTPDGQGGFTGGMKPAATVTAPVPARIDSPSGPSGFSKEYLQKAADPNRTGRYMISIEKAQELLKQTNEGTAGLPDPNNFDSDWEYQDALDAYGKTQDNDSDFENMTDEPDDWFDESKEKIGNMDADDFDAAMARLKKLAGAGPMKTVYDPDRRVYRNMPTAQQPPKQLKK